MQNAIKKEIKRLCRRAFQRSERAESDRLKYQNQFRKRTGVAAGPTKIRPSFRPVHFDPKYCCRNANFLAKTIWHKVLNETYEITPAIHFEIDKPNGGKRPIMAFSIPDSALANVVMWRSRDRNLKNFSASSFAYHPAKNLFDAIIEIQNYDHNDKYFAVQIDFRGFFDSIPAGYLTARMNEQHRIALTPHERYVFRKFLHHQFARPAEYAVSQFSRRPRGTPQGSSVSLVLANLANNELDIALDAVAGKFVRFADDVVALCDSYEEAQKIEQCFHDHCKRSGIEINREKSPGTAIISETTQELRTYPNYDYLGYRFSEAGLSVPDKTINRLKTKISRLINLYLIHYLKFGFNPSRASISPFNYDWDLLGLIYELRLSLYGGLSEADLDSFVNKGTRPKKMKGLMGFYCLLTESSKLKEIDGWMLSTTRRALKVRNQILAARYGANCPTPSNSALATGYWLDLNAWRGTNYPDPRMPSLMRGWRAARKYYYTYGLEDVAAPRYGSTNDLSSLFDYS